MNEHDNKVFVCFSQRDRYKIAEPIVYHLRNYGIPTWYDRYELLMGHDRIEKNLIEGALKCAYAMPILSENSENSPCFLEELSIIKQRFRDGDIVVFPVLYELAPDQIPSNLQWIKELVFKEADRCSGTREICNHVACRYTDDIVGGLRYNKIQDIVDDLACGISPTSRALLSVYLKIDSDNLDARVSMLYATYLSLTSEQTINPSRHIKMVKKVFERLFSETKLHLEIDYRDLWLLENSICILIDCYLAS